LTVNFPNLSILSFTFRKKWVRIVSYPPFYPQKSLYQTMPTIEEQLESASYIFKRVGIEYPMRQAEWIMMEVLQCTRIELWNNADKTLAPEALEQFQYWASRRKNREPIQYIMGKCEFYGLAFEVNPNVLIPRPETEQLVELGFELLDPSQQKRVLDVGTGSGCIAVSLKHHAPQWDIWACDVSEEALWQAKKNASHNKTAIRFVYADVTDKDFTDYFPNNFDLIISNPPYIPSREAVHLQPEVREHEPNIALFSGEDSLTFYNVIADHAFYLLKKGGYIAFECHADFAQDVHRLMEQFGFREVRTIQDYAGRDRMVCGKKG
jgi:release factor glutamine methyltransferase